MNSTLRITTGVLVVVAALSSSAPAARAQGQPLRVVSGATRDSASGLPLAGALIDLRSTTDRRAIRSDEAGLFRIAALERGRYTISVLRIGFAELKAELELGERDTVLTLAMRAIPQRLVGFRVRGDISAIYGMVGTLPDLRPLPGTKIQVIGANASQFTDSVGGFFVPVDKAGSYLVRMSHDGFVDRIFPIDVPRDRAVEASRVLDPGPGTPKSMEPLFKDADLRLRYRGMNSAIVTGAELRRIGGSLADALPFTPTVATKGLRAWGADCLLVNGVRMSHANLRMYDVNEIEAIEVYAANGDNTGDLKRQCDGVRRPTIGAPALRPSPSAGNAVKYIVVWLRK